MTKMVRDFCLDADGFVIAWQVNFNLRVSSFEGNLQGLRHLVELALSSPYVVSPKVTFVSSIGVLTSEYFILSGEI